MPVSNVSFVRATLAAILLGLAALLIIVGFNLWLEMLTVELDRITHPRGTSTSIRVSRRVRASSRWRPCRRSHWHRVPLKLPAKSRIAQGDGVRNETAKTEPRDGSIVTL
jgi:hypothetical protein